MSDVGPSPCWTTVAFLSVPPRHMFRHQSELRQLKGGYIEAEVSLGTGCPHQCIIQLSLAQENDQGVMCGQPNVLK